MIGIGVLPSSVYAESREAIVQDIVADLGRLNLFSLIILTACVIGTRFIPDGASRKRNLLLGLAVLTFLVAQGRSVVGAYRNSALYQPRKDMTLSDLQILEIRHNGRMFGGKNVIPLLVADYMPNAKIFLYRDNVYSKELLSWSGRDPDKTFIIDGYHATMDESFKATCLGRPHAIDDGLYIATPLSLYEKEKQVFIMTDGQTDYLIPGSWRVSRHE